MAWKAKNSNTKLLDELEALSQSLYQPNASSGTAPSRRTNSLAIPRSSAPAVSSLDGPDQQDRNEDHFQLNPKPRSRRMSLSPWRSRPKPENEPDPSTQPGRNEVSTQFTDEQDSGDKKGIWGWKPIRALSHIGMQKLGCLFSVEVVAAQGLPASMNGLRLSVCVRKKETKDGAVHTMPSRVLQGAADFEETLFLRCHVYCTSAPPLKFEPRPFLIYAFAVDAEELEFGRSSVDVSKLIHESIEKNLEGTRVRQWDVSFKMSGKAKGGKLVLKLGFQIMDNNGGGGGIYSQAEGQKQGRNKPFSPSIGRRQSKTSFSVLSPRLTSRADSWTPSKSAANADFQEIDDLNLDDPPPSVQKPEEEEEPKVVDLDLPEFDIVDKGIEVQDRGPTDDAQSDDNSSDKRSVLSEVVKEMVHDQVHLTRLTELDSIAQQIKALESMMGEEANAKTQEQEEEETHKLDAEEETVTREFLQMLEVGDDKNKFLAENTEINSSKLEEDEDSRVLLPDLGKGLGSVVQTRNGGYLAAMNPFDTLVWRKDTPKLAIQMSKPFILPLIKSANGIEIFQRMAAVGLEELSSEILSLMPLEELKGKTAEQIAFEGIASAIISSRNKEIASSSAARTVTVIKAMATAMASGRSDRISTGIWNVGEDPLTADEILAFSMQKIEDMAVEALKIQAELAEEDAPFDISPAAAKNIKNPFAHSISVDAFNSEDKEAETIIKSLLIQLRDPVRQFEAVGGPMIALISANRADIEPEVYSLEKKYKVASLHVGGMKVRSGGEKNEWDSERQRLTAVQWLVVHGLGKAGKKGKGVTVKGPDFLWSISSRIMADMWLKPIRNPDVKFVK